MWTTVFIAISGALQLMSGCYRWWLQEIQSLSYFQTTAKWFNHTTMFHHCLEWNQRHPTFSWYWKFMKIQVLDISGKERWTWNLFYWDAYVTSSRLPRLPPKLPALSVRESSDRDAAAAFEEEKRKAGWSQGAIFRGEMRMFQGV